MEEGSLSDWKLTSPWFSLADDGTVLQYPNNHKKDYSWVVSTDNNGNPISKPPPSCQIYSGVQSFIKAWGKRSHISDIDWINIMLINSFRSRNEDVLRESHGLDVTVYAMIIDPIDPKNHSIQSNCGIFNGNVLISQSCTNHRNGSRIINNWFWMQICRMPDWCIWYWSAASKGGEEGLSAGHAQLRWQERVHLGGWEFSIWTEKCLGSGIRPTMLFFWCCYCSYSSKVIQEASYAEGIWQVLVVGTFIWFARRFIQNEWESAWCELRLPSVGQKVDTSHYSPISKTNSILLCERLDGSRCCNPQK